MLALFISSFLALFFFITLGLFYSKFLQGSKNFAELTLIGLVISNSITTFSSLFFPTNMFILGTFVLGCLLLFIFIWKEFKTLISLLVKKKYILLISLPFILIGFFVSLGPPLNWDTGLYHLQSIKWIEEYSVIPGLANLHARFGFNPNVFTLFSLTSFQSIFKQEIFSINFTVFAVLVIYFINKLYYHLKLQGVTNLFLFYFIIFYIILRYHHDLSSPTPDYLATSITLFIFVRILDLSSQKKKMEIRNYFPILILSVYVITVKLAVFPIILVVIFIFLQYKSQLKKSLWLIPLLSFIILPWLIRNIIITGWLIFPFSAIDLFNFDWKVPIEWVNVLKINITGWARIPRHAQEAANMNLLDWFPIWWGGINFYEKTGLISSIAFPSIALGGQALKKLKIDIFSNSVLVISLIGVLFWFFMAPSFRFGISFICVAVISPLLWVRFNLMKQINRKVIYFIIIAILLVKYTRITLHNYETVFFQKNFCLMPQKMQTPNSVKFKSYKIGVIDIHIPIDDDRCFDHSIPCADIYGDKSISLRGKNIESGFKHVNKDQE